MRTSNSLFQRFFWGAWGIVFLFGIAYAAFHYLTASPATLESASFKDRQGNAYTLDSFRGKPLVVNIWASWCGPCVAEMPTLDDLALKMRAKGGDVLTILAEPLMGKAIATFSRGQIRNLVAYHDFKGEIATALGVSGLPLTVFIDDTGREVFRLPGALNWSGAEAAALIRQHLKVDL